MVLCYVKLKSHVLSFEVEELILCGRLRTFVARSRSSSLDISDRARRSHSTPCEKASTWSSSNFAANATFRSFTYSIQHSATTKKKTSYKTAPCDEHTTSSKNINLIKTHFRRTQPPLLAPRLSPTRGAALLEGASSCRIVPAHHPQQRGLESHLLTISDKAPWSHSTPCETAPSRSSSTLAAQRSSTYSIQHSATNKKNILQDCTMRRTYNL